MPFVHGLEVEDLRAEIWRSSRPGFHDVMSIIYFLKRGGLVHEKSFDLLNFFSLDQGGLRAFAEHGR